MCRRVLVCMDCMPLNPCFGKPLLQPSALKAQKEACTCISDETPYAACTHNQATDKPDTETQGVLPLDKNTVEVHVVPKKTINCKQMTFLSLLFLSILFIAQGTAVNGHPAVAFLCGCPTAAAGFRCPDSFTVKTTKKFSDQAAKVSMFA